jgi:serine/threonine protein kinase
VRVLDFGYAKLADNLIGDGSLTAANALLGTPLYMAPEQVQASREVDARADLWSLGVMAYELVVGRAPFPSTNVADLFVEILASPIPAPLHRRPIAPPAPRRLGAPVALARPRARSDRLAERDRPLRARSPPRRRPERRRSPRLRAALVALALIALALAVARSR